MRDKHLQMKHESREIDSVRHNESIGKISKQVFA